MRDVKKKEICSWDAGSTSSRLFRQALPVNCAGRTCKNRWNEVELRPNKGVNNLKNYLSNCGFIDNSIQIYADEFR